MNPAAADWDKPVLNFPRIILKSIIDLHVFGELDKRYGGRAFYVHLKRDTNIQAGRMRELSRHQV